jgi:Domain of unknown function (DUF927)
MILMWRPTLSIFGSPRRPSSSSTSTARSRYSRYKPGQISGRHPKIFTGSCSAAPRVRCTSQVGWCDGSFVLPDGVIGPSANKVILQSEVRVNGEYGIGGTFDEWKTLVAARAVGNPVMLFSTSAGFAGPLLKLCHTDGTIFHFRGKSLDAARAPDGRIGLDDDCRDGLVH